MPAARQVLNTPRLKPTPAFAGATPKTPVHWLGRETSNAKILRFA